MADTKIEWAKKVWNPITGCTKCSPGCLNCYAERMAKRLYWMGMEKPATLPEYMKFKDGWKDGHIELCNHRLDQPLHWRKPSRIFVCSMSDMFHEKVPFSFTDRVFDTMSKCPQHTFLVLTKRPKQILSFVGEKGEYWFTLPNVHLGVSISTQAEADEKIPILLQIPAAVRYVSLEPMLGPIDLAGKDKSRMGKTGYLADYFRPFYCNHCGRQHSRPGTVTMPCGYCGGHDGFRREKSLRWVIVGGESGPGARPMHPDWVRNIRDQCVAAGVKFYFKQWGKFKPSPKGTIAVCNDGSFQRDPTGKFDWLKGYAFEKMMPVGKKKAGCLLDGKEWKQLP